VLVKKVKVLRWLRKKVYFSCDAYELERMTHQEDPWISARGGLPIDTPSDAIISKESMREYYKARAEAED
jgi:uncharacterized phage-associated protein